MAKDRPGKEFENELIAACKQLKAYSHGSNNDNPACDRFGSIPARTSTGASIGVSLLIEAKERSNPNLRFSDLSAEERKHLEAHSNSGGISLILIKFVSHKPRCWAITWEDWAELEDGHGFEFAAKPGLVHGSNKPKRARGTASFSLAEGLRPPTLVELFKIDRPHGLGKCWDLSPVINPVLEAL